MKKHIRFLFGIIGTILVCGMGPGSLSAAETTARIEILLVSAGNGEGGVDAALKPYAGTLKRLFRFDGYDLLKKQGMKVKLPGSGTASLSGGQSLKVTTKPGGGGSVNAEVEWIRGGRRLLHTRLQLRPGKPAVLGGPRSGDETLLLIMVLR